ncbi:hypothetical protein GIB67_025877 [Kingdonia uniflora]|uniref:Uncharacterized protein n=1 Tax=Kingdonia uniflora TaxID=39325 RepID=A0A7J7MD68_9MAGN|nr:hypothetical protein GIB67_025877 [Kingdonia uniflora]
MGRMIIEIVFDAGAYIARFLRSIMTNKRTHKCMEDVVAYDMVRPKRIEENNAKINALGMRRISTGMKDEYLSKEDDEDLVSESDEPLEDDNAIALPAEGRHLNPWKKTSCDIMRCSSPVSNNTVRGALTNSLMHCGIASMKGYVKAFRPTTPGHSPGIGHSLGN